MAINVGRFKWLVKFQKPTQSKDAAGNRVTEWATAFCAFCEVSDVSGREFYEAAANQMENVVTFTLRWREDLTPDMRILFKDMTYTIMQINHLGYKRDFIKIKARMAQGTEEPYGTF